MNFHEKLDLKYDVDAMKEGAKMLQEKLGNRVGHPVDGKGFFGGWALQSQDGDWRNGFEAGGYYEEQGELHTWENVPPVQEYCVRTEACFGIFEDILNDLEEKGFYPHRSRITVFDPGQATYWHSDAYPENYSVRLHIPFITNPDSIFEVEDVGAIHMPADGHANLVDVATMHRAYNHGDTIRMHFLAQVWPTKYSKKFIVTESDKNIFDYHNMKGYQIYKQVMDAKAKKES